MYRSFFLPPAIIVSATLNDRKISHIPQKEKVSTTLNFDEYPQHSLLLALPLYGLRCIVGSPLRFDMLPLSMPYAHKSRRFNIQ
jgi:hypothetical protein